MNITTWECEVLECVSEMLEMTTSDAQAFLDANNFYLTQALAYDLYASQAAEFVIGKALVMEAPEQLNKYQIICETGEHCSKVINLGMCFSMLSTWLNDGYYYYVVNVETNKHILVRSPFDGVVRKSTVI